MSFRTLARAGRWRAGGTVGTVVRVRRRTRAGRVCRARNAHSAVAVSMLRSPQAPARCTSTEGPEASVSGDRRSDESISRERVPLVLITRVRARLRWAVGSSEPTRSQSAAVRDAPRVRRGVPVSGNPLTGRRSVVDGGVIVECRFSSPRVDARRSHWPSVVMRRGVRRAQPL